MSNKPFVRETQTPIHKYYFVIFALGNCMGSFEFLLYGSRFKQNSLTSNCPRIAILSFVSSFVMSGLFFFQIQDQKRLHRRGQSLELFEKGSLSSKCFPSARVKQRSKPRRQPHLTRENCVPSSTRQERAKFFVLVAHVPVVTYENNIMSIGDKMCGHKQKSISKHIWRSNQT